MPLQEDSVFFGVSPCSLRVFRSLSLLPFFLFTSQVRAARLFHAAVSMGTNETYAFVNKFKKIVPRR